MKNILLLIALITAGITAKAQTHNLDWAKAFHGTASTIPYATTVDKWSNVFTTGTMIGGTVDFDPGSASYNLSTTAANIDDCFISKLDANGDFKWAKNIGQSAYGNDIVTDSFGNVYVAGDFTQTVDFDPGPGTFFLTATADWNVSGSFILKLDSLGNFIWARQFKGTSSIFNKSIAIGPNETIYCTGSFVDTADFDSGIGIYNMYALGQMHTYITNLDLNGDLIWAKQIPGKNITQPAKLEFDLSSNIYLSITFDDSIDVDPGVGITQFYSSTQYDAAVIKLNMQGYFLWAKHLDGVNRVFPPVLKTDDVGNLYIAGYCNDTMDIDLGPSVQLLVPKDGYGGYMISLDSLGNQRWEHSVGGWENGVILPTSIEIDDNNIVYVLGAFSDTVDFDPGLGTQQQQSQGNGYDGFISKYNDLGSLIEASTLPSSGSVVPFSSFMDDNNSLYVSGHFTGNTDLDPSNGVLSIINNNTSTQLDAFVLKLSVATPLPVLLLNFEAQKVSSTTVLNWSTTQEANNSHFNIQRSTDGINFKRIGRFNSKAENGNATYKIDYEYVDDNPHYGLNYYRLEQVDIDRGINFSETLTLLWGARSNRLNIYPNPTNDILKVDLSHVGLKIVIRDMSGKVVIESTENKINVASLSNGMYFLEAIQKGNKLVTKFIKE